MRKLIEQFLKFGVVGVIAFCIDYGVLMLLSQVFGVDPVLSAAVSFCVSVVFNYIASMKYVFQRRDDMSRQREFIIFIALSVVGLVINELIMLAGTAALGSGAIAVTLTKLVATAVVMVWNFLSRKKWLEAKDPEQQ
ncbi:GtrA family protein [Paratractidigestivibacter sp.]|uniref:GtrA family protein n=1 Tax=Paratractidigestivibacter sp. TaxID=2847316 RepID=UPI002ABD4102|nr:GtrA family protein [Paratractidigestivibacter sp.]